MAEIRINATGGVKLYDADDSHYAQILAGTITSNVDALTLGHASADFNIPVKVLGTTPTLTIGDAGAEDTKIVFDGNAQDFHIGLDDSADDLVIGLGSSLGTTTHMAFDETGAVTKPLQPAFLVHPSTGQDNISLDSNVTVVWGTEVFDINADFASNTFTAPVTGKYQLNVSMRIDNLDADTASYEVEITSSNRTYTTVISPGTLDSDATYGMPLSLSCLADMDASDTVYVRINVGSGGAAQADIHANSRFSGYLAC